MKKTYIFLISLLLVLVLVPNNVSRAEIENEKEDDDRFEQTEQGIIPAPVTNPAPVQATLPTEPVVENANVNTITNTTPETIAPIIESVPEPVSIIPNTSSTSIPVMATPSPWPWYLARAFGIASFLLLFTSAVVGMLMTTGLMHRIFSPTSSWSLHRTTGIFMILSIVLHIASLLFDTYMDFGFADILLPFVSPYRPLLVTLGIFGFYLFIPVIWTSLIWVDKHSRLWRVTHFLSFPMYLAIFFHSLLIGTDSDRMWMQAIYWTTGSIMVLLIMYRLIWKLRASAARP